MCGKSAGRNHQLVQKGASYGTVDLAGNRAAGAASRSRSRDGMTLCRIGELIRNHSDLVDTLASTMKANDGVSGTSQLVY